jgi:hypothetical protein
MADAHIPSDELVSEPYDAAVIREKAEEAAEYIMRRHPGSYMQWIDGTTLELFAKDGSPIATLYLEPVETLQ